MTQGTAHSQTQNAVVAVSGHVHAAEQPVRRPGQVRRGEQLAVGVRRARLRDGLRHAQPQLAGAVGGAVRRLRQHGAGDFRPVPVQWSGQVGATERSRVSAAARLRRYEVTRVMRL